MTLEEILRELNVYDIDIEDVIEICKEALQKQKNKYLSLVMDWDENTDKQGLYMAMCLISEPTWEDKNGIE